MFRLSTVRSIVGLLPGAGPRAATRRSAAATPTTVLSAAPSVADRPSDGGLGRIVSRFGADARVAALGAAAVPLAACGNGDWFVFITAAIFVVSVSGLLMLRYLHGPKSGVADQGLHDAALRAEVDAVVSALERQTQAIKAQTRAIEAQTGAIRETAEAADPLFGHETRLEEVTQRLFDAYAACVGTEEASIAPAEQAEITTDLILTLDTDALRAEFPQQFLAAVLLGTLCELDAGRYDHAAKYLAMAEKVEDGLNVHDQALLGLFATYIVAKISGDSRGFVQVIEANGGALKVATFVRNTLAAVCECAGPATGNMVKEFPAVQAMLGFIIAEAEAAKEAELTSRMEKILKDPRLSDPFTTQNNLRSLLEQYAGRQAYEALRGDLGFSVPEFMGQIGYGVSVNEAVYAKLVVKIALEFTRLDDVEGETKDRLRRWLQALVQEFILAYQSGIFAGKPGHDDDIGYIQAIEEYLAGDQSPDSRGAIDRLLAVWLEKQQP